MFTTRNCLAFNQPPCWSSGVSDQLDMDEYPLKRPARQRAPLSLRTTVARYPTEQRLLCMNMRAHMRLFGEDWDDWVSIEHGVDDAKERPLGEAVRLWLGGEGDGLRVTELCVAEGKSVLIPWDAEFDEETAVATLPRLGSTAGMPRLGTSPGSLSRRRRDGAPRPKIRSRGGGLSASGGWVPPSPSILEEEMQHPFLAQRAEWNGPSRSAQLHIVDELPSPPATPAPASLRCSDYTTDLSPPPRPRTPVPATWSPRSRGFDTTFSPPDTPPSDSHPSIPSSPDDMSIATPPLPSAASSPLLAALRTPLQSLRKFASLSQIRPPQRQRTASPLRVQEILAKELLATPRESFTSTFSPSPSPVPKDRSPATRTFGVPTPDRSRDTTPATGSPHISTSGSAGSVLALAAGTPARTPPALVSSPRSPSKLARRGRDRHAARAAAHADAERREAAVWSRVEV